MLVPLETFIADSNFPIDQIAPAVREGLTDLGGGTLYALFPTYTSNALFYNKDIFDARGISYPTDGMTWDEILNLARELSYEENGEKIYGISFGNDDLGEKISMYTKSLGIQKYDKDFRTFTVDTPEMEKAWNTIVDLVHEGVIAPRDDFIYGRVAMKIGDNNDLETLSVLFSEVRDWESDGQMPKKFNWDIVTAPTHPEAPGVSGEVYYSYIMGINANAANPNLA